MSNTIENFATYDDTFNRLPDVIALPGKYNGTTENKITIENTDIVLNYQFLLYLDGQYITWNGDYQPEGITIIILGANNVFMGGDRKSTNLIFLEGFSTYSIGTLKMKQPNSNDTYSLEVCMTDFENYNKVCRTTMSPDINNCQDAFNISSDYLNITPSTRVTSPRPNGISVCIDFTKNPYNVPSLFNSILPPCPSSSEKCWSGGKFINGLCYDAATNTGYFTGCNDKRCYFPDKQVNGINTWWNKEGSGKFFCDAPPNQQEKTAYDGDINNVAGSGIINMKDGTKKMVDNASNFRANIYNMQSKIASQDVDILSKTQEYKEAQKMLDKNREIINDKMKILESRNRQLQISIDNNIYWKKFLYALFAIIIGIIVIVILFSSFMKKSN